MSLTDDLYHQCCINYTWVKIYTEYGPKGAYVFFTVDVLRYWYEN